MAKIGKPVRKEPIEAPAPWEYPEPHKEPAPRPLEPAAP